MMRYRKNRRLFMVFVEKWLTAERHKNLESAEILTGINKQLLMALPRKAMSKKHFKKASKMRSKNENLFLRQREEKRAHVDEDTFKLFRAAVIEAAGDARLSIELLVDIYEKLQNSGDVEHCITQLEDRFKQTGVLILDTDAKYREYENFEHFWDIHTVSDGPSVSVEKPAYILAKNDDPSMMIPIKRGTIAKLKETTENPKEEEQIPEEETSKEQIPDEQIPEEETSEEQISEEETSKEQIPDEQIPEEEKDKNET